MTSRSVVVTGWHAITPAGIGVEPLWAALMEGRTHGSRVTKFDVSRNTTQIAALASDFDPIACGLTAGDVERLDRSAQLAVVSARASALDAGLDSLDARLRNRVGVCIGTAIGGIERMERAFRVACPGGGTEKPTIVSVHPERISRLLYGQFLAASVSTEVARDHAFTGPCTTMATGCTAGLDAIGAATSMLQAGMADVMITGGVDAPITPIVLTSFDNIKALTRRNDAPDRASRPFDRDRDGFLLAEGCGILVLESEEFAVRRGADIRGRVLGYASNSNAHHMTGLPGDGELLAGAITQALSRARVSAGEVGYINAHGSSTLQNDRNETAAFKLTFGERARRIPISSTKACVGHSLGAASAIESIVCFLALTRGIVPPTLNYQTPCPDCDLDYVPNEPREYRLRVVENNASGFSGIHSSAIFAHMDHRLDG